MVRGSDGGHLETRERRGQCRGDATTTPNSDDDDDVDDGDDDSRGRPRRRKFANAFSVWKRVVQLLSVPGTVLGASWACRRPGHGIPRPAGSVLETPGADAHPPPPSPSPS